MQDFKEDNAIINYKDVSKPLNRKKIYYLAIFNGYIWYSKKLYSGLKFDRKSPGFTDTLSSLEDTEEFKTHKAYKLSDLVKLKIDNIADFELYIKKNPHDNSIYTLKVHYGLTERYKTVFCSKDLNLFKII